MIGRNLVSGFHCRLYRRSHFDIWAYCCCYKADGIAHTSADTTGAKLLRANMLWPTSRLLGMPPVRPVSPTEDGGKKHCR